MFNNKAYQKEYYQRPEIQERIRLQYKIPCDHKRTKPGRPVRYDADLIKTILKRREEGMKAKDIAANTGIPLRTVYYHLHRLKVANMPKKGDSE